ncbi:hypothetical protein J6590_091037 [Homalodisca vitripennis]|nr:hypothetical protein J6590_091037 [Homalodisca vitripennis]
MLRELQPVLLGLIVVPASCFISVNVLTADLVLVKWSLKCIAIKARTSFSETGIHDLYIRIVAMCLGMFICGRLFRKWTQNISETQTNVAKQDDQLQNTMSEADEKRRVCRELTLVSESFQNTDVLSKVEDQTYSDYDETIVGLLPNVDTISLSSASTTVSLLPNVDTISLFSSSTIVSLLPNVDTISLSSSSDIL